MKTNQVAGADPTQEVGIPDQTLARRRSRLFDRAGRHIRWRLSDIDDWLESRVVSPMLDSDADAA